LPGRRGHDDDDDDDEVLTAGRVARAAKATIDLEGSSRLAVLTLFGLNFVDEFDRLAFATLTPEIRDAFDLSDSQIVAIGSLSALFVLVSSIPVGYLADRVPRLRLARIAAGAWGAMGLLLGLSWSVPVLFFARFFSGAAKCSNEVVHTGLLADYYAPDLHPRVFRLHRLANPLSGVASVVAGGIGLLLGWRWAFILLAIPTFVLLASMRGLSEPHRGGSIDAAAAAVAETRERASYRVASRELLRIPTLRRLMVGFLVFGVGLIAFGQMLSLFFEDVYDFGPLGRGAVTFVFGAGQVIGMLLVGRRIGHTARQPEEHSVSQCALGFAVFAASSLLLAVAPWWPVAIVATVGAAAGLGLVAPTMPMMLVCIAPPNIRAQAQSFTLLAIGAGALLALPLAAVGERYGYRYALAAVASVVFVALPMLLAARRSIARDTAIARASVTSALPRTIT
jgi:predicted MFS family arabinose efflux permease